MTTENVYMNLLRNQIDFLRSENYERSREIKQLLEVVIGLQEKLNDLTVDHNELIGIVNKHTRILKGMVGD
jgi:uncharacterized coiled-coil DUF342 family protein